MAPLIGTYDTTLTRHIFESLAFAAGICLHVRVLTAATRTTSSRPSSRRWRGRCAPRRRSTRAAAASRAPRACCDGAEGRGARLRVGQPALGGAGAGAGGADVDGDRRRRRRAGVRRAGGARRRRVRRVHVRAAGGRRRQADRRRLAPAGRCSASAWACRCCSQRGRGARGLATRGLRGLAGHGGAAGRRGAAAHGVEHRGRRAGLGAVRRGRRRTRFYFVHSYALRAAGAGAGRGRRADLLDRARRAVRRRGRAGRAVARPSSTRRSPATPAPACSPTGWGHL